MILFLKVSMSLVYICVLDFEATCIEPKTKTYKQEIIEFPSILYKLENDTLTIMSEFQEYVRPEFNKRLSNFCTELTGITQETVDKADIFANVFERHNKWLNKQIEGNTRDLAFLTCGHWDLKTMLPSQLRLLNARNNIKYRTYINIKDEFMHFYKKNGGGLSRMLADLNMKFEGRPHSGIDDTRNIGRILEKMVADGHTDFKYNQV